MIRPPSARRIALIVEYDGAPYAGSQLQKRHPSIQAELEAAVERLTGSRERVAFAGRTDAGVHALGQVAAFTTTSRLARQTFVSGLNAWLPETIAVQRAVEVPLSFNPRRDATSRTYRYSICNVPARSPLARARAWRVPEPLDDRAMRRAARILIGEHDFAAFSRKEGTTTRRRVLRCDVERRGARVAVEIEANAFLRQQVRRTVGALVEVGRGRLTATELRRLLRLAQPNTAGPVAPAHGLCLLTVTYAGLDLAPESCYDA